VQRIKDLLSREYERRSGGNHRYSQRAFANDLGVSKSFLNDILNTKKQPSEKMIVKITEALKLSQLEQEQILKAELSGLEIREDKYSEMYHWQHFAILNLIETKRSTGDADFYAEALGIELSVAEQALETLVSLGLIERQDEKFVRTQNRVTTGMEVPSHTIKCLHSEMLGRADRALFEVSPEQREVTALTFAADPEDYLKIKKETKKFREKLAKIAANTQDPEHVYTVAVQVFPHTKINI